MPTPESPNEPPMSLSKDTPSPAQPQAQPPRPPIATAPAPGSPVGLGPYAPPPGAQARSYNPVLPAVGAGVLTAVLTVVLGESALSLMKRHNGLLETIGQVSTYFDARTLQMTFRLSRAHEIEVACIAGVLAVILTALAAATTRHSPSRGLLFFAVWGIVGLSAASAALTIAATTESHLGWVYALMTIEAAAGWGAMVGWIPAALAAALRRGRPVGPAAVSPR